MSIGVIVLLAVIWFFIVCPLLYVFFGDWDYLEGLALSFSTNVGIAVLIGVVAVVVTFWSKTA